jgi:hypothetical protein
MNLKEAVCRAARADLDDVIRLDHIPQLCVLHAAAQK